MQITVFAKKRTTKEGKTFYTYLTTLTKKNGETQTVGVKFREDCGAPKSFPCNIVVEKGNCNLSTKSYANPDTGVQYTNNTLWISAWTNGTDYVDTSMDEFM